MARIAGVDLPREKRVEIGLTYIFGIGRVSSNRILAQAGVNPDTRVRDLTDDDVKIEPVETHKYLFTTNTCPNCRMAKKMLEGEDLEIIDAEKNPDMARQFGIMQAPTLVITDGEHLKKYVNASNIQKYVDEELD